MTDSLVRVLQKRLGCVCLVVLGALVIHSSAFAQTLRTEKNYQDAILQGLVNQEELSQLQFDFLDFNGDGILDVVDLIDFLLTTQNDPPTASFESRRSRINEGESGTVTIVFTKEFTGFVSFTVRPADGPGGTMSAVDGAGEDYQVLDETGAPISDAAGQVLSLPVSGATSVDISIEVLDDTELELIERIEVQLVPGEGYILEAPTNHFAFIHDNDGRWTGIFVREGNSVAPTFDFDIVQVGNTFTGTVVVEGMDSGLFRLIDSGTVINFSGTNPDVSVFQATITPSSAISRGSTRFNSSFTRTYTLVSTPETQVLNEDPEGPDTIPAQFDRLSLITGSMTESLGSSNSQLGGLVESDRAGTFYLVKEVVLPDTLSQIVDAFAAAPKARGEGTAE